MDLEVATTHKHTALLQLHPNILAGRFTFCLIRAWGFFLTGKCLQNSMRAGFGLFYEIPCCCVLWIVPSSVRSIDPNTIHKTHSIPARTHKSLCQTVNHYSRVDSEQQQKSKHKPKPYITFYTDSGDPKYFPLEIWAKMGCDKITCFCDYMRVGAHTPVRCLL